MTDQANDCPRRRGSCAERVGRALKGRIDDLRQLWAAYCDSENEDGEVEELGTLYDYGLCFDYVAPGTFENQGEGYFRYQLSWGGPGDEFRIFCNVDYSPHRIEYWFLDWWDGAHIVLGGEDDQLLEEIFVEFFVGSGTAQAQVEDSAE